MLGLKAAVGAFSVCLAGDSPVLVLKPDGLSNEMYPEFLNEFVNTGL